MGKRKQQKPDIARNRLAVNFIPNLFEMLPAKTQPKEPMLITKKDNKDR